MIIRLCQGCNTGFKLGAKSSRKKFCGPACRSRHNNRVQYRRRRDRITMFGREMAKIGSLAQYANVVQNIKGEWRWLWATYELEPLEIDNG